jgi:N-acetylglucosaminyldiphosphoundecaprenol N-acetyl-beta-D-mannosaminyltransferase
MRELIVITGIPIDNLTMEQTLDYVTKFIASGQPHQVATVNADFIVRAWDDLELRHILQDADLLTADGMPLVWGARLLGVPLAGRVTGADLVPALAQRGAKLGWRFYFLGARPGIAARAAQILTANHSTLQIVGIDSPPQSTIFDMEPGMIERIRQAHPDILLVAFGNPKQEKWIHMNLRQMGVPVCIGVGGTFDFIAGEVQRAPLWMQRSGLEWLYRLLQEPRRMWRRYVIDIFQFGRFFLAQWLRQLGGRRFESLELGKEMSMLPLPPSPWPVR